MPLILREILIRLVPVLFVAACVLAPSWFAYQRGFERGRLEVQAASDQQRVTDLTGVIDRYAQTLADSNLLSEHLLQATAKREAHDRATTKALKEVLHETANLRAACVYDTRVMRQLEAARDRAAAAAAAGLDGTVPATGEPDG